MRPLLPGPLPDVGAVGDAAGGLNLALLGALVLWAILAAERAGRRPVHATERVTL